MMTLNSVDVDDDVDDDDDNDDVYVFYLMHCALI